MDEQSTVGWVGRKNALLGEVRESLVFYAGAQKAARFWQRVTSSIVMIGSILAPATVATGSIASGATTATDWTLLGIPPTALPTVSLIVTLLVAVAEGFRRIFRFEQRWASAWLCAQSLHAAKEEFLDDIESKQVGDAEWVAALQSFRKNVNGAKTQDGNDFFQAIKSDAPTDKDTQR